MTAALKALISTVLLFSFIQGVHALSSGADKSTKTRLEKYLRAAQQEGFTGAVLVAHNEEILISRGYGFADKEKQIKNTDETVFTIGSVTKQFTATAILTLYGNKKLDLADPISRFFPALPDDKQNITIHQLLTHSSGMVSNIGEGDFDYIPTDEYFTRLFNTKLLHQPGSKYAYSNAGYSVLARIIEVVSGQSYEHFLKENLFQPAGMDSTGYFLPDWDKRTIANGYYRNVRKMGTMISRYQKAGKISWVLKGNGGIHSTTKDMFQWYQALKHSKVLSPELMTLLTKPYVREFGDAHSFYAYGWAIYHSDRSTKLINHNGGNNIFFHDFLWLPEEDVLILLFTNAASQEAELAWTLEKMLFDEDYLANPVRKNPHHFVFDFIRSNSPELAMQLLKELKQLQPRLIADSDFLNEVGYMILEIGRYGDWAIELFKLNTLLFPDEANGWDSLGDGYKASRDKDLAIVAYKKAHQLDPSLQASVNSLNELGVVVEVVKTPEITLAESLLQEYVGIYQLNSSLLLDISLSHEGLIIQPSGRNSMGAKAESEYRFYLQEMDTHIEFNRGEHGEVDSLTVIAGSQKKVAKKQ